MARTIALYLEIDRLRSVNARLMFALRSAGVAVDSGLADAAHESDPAYCPKCEMIVPTIDEGETCAQCKLVL